MSERMRWILLLLLVAGMLWVGLRSGAATRNEAYVDPGRGLVLEGPGQLVLEERVRLRGSSFTMEVWLDHEGAPPEGVNQEILSIQDGAGVPPFLLGGWPSGVLVRLAQDNPTGRPQADRYGRTGATGIRGAVAVVGDEQGVRIFYDGRLVRHDAPASVHRPRAPIEGTLVLGSSGGGWPPWRGCIEAVALHDEALDVATLARRARGGLSVSTGSEPVLAYDFRSREAAPGFRCPSWVEDPARRPLGIGRSRARVTRSCLVDFGLNVLYFLGLGYLLGRGRHGMLLALVIGVALSLGIEVLQGGLPGRDSSWIDVVANGLGSLVGATIADRGPSPRP